MKALPFNSIFRFPAAGLLCLLFAVSGNLNAQVLDTTLTISTVFNGNKTVEVHSSSADVEIRTWAKNELRVDFRISLEAGTEAELRDFYHMLESKMNIQQSDVEDGKVDPGIIYETYQKQNRFWRIQFKGERREYKLKEFETKLLVHMPAESPLEARVNFHRLEVGNLRSRARIRLNSCEFIMGDCRELDLQAGFSNEMIIGEVNGPARLDLNSSSAEIKSVKGELEVEAGFSNLEIEEAVSRARLYLNSSSFDFSDIGNLELQGNFIRRFTASRVGEAELSVNSSKFEIREAGSMELKRASFSEFRIDKIERLEISQSSSSKFYLEQAGSVETDHASFSEFKIGELERLFSIDANSGEINISKVSAGFEEIDIDAEFLTAFIAIEEGANCMLDADLNFPNYQFENMSITGHEKNMSHEVLEGYKGDPGKAASSIELKCNSCKVTIE